MTIRAVWNGVVIAESERTVRVEGNHYFPKEALNMDLLRPGNGPLRRVDVTVAGTDGG
ncbi:DUF427 domain-containing protein [Nonomuraea sp. 10N515B]|uniref:DUF427 domain-containing protein n=1 Tax=Nonomuraea sp. 10N515B TaxID=3457422 RepID=UPI003FCED29E